MGDGGFKSRNLWRRPHRVEFCPESLEARKLLSMVGPVAPAAGASSQQALEAATLAAPAVAPALSNTAATSISAATSAPLTTSTSSQGPNPTNGIQASLPTNNSSSTNTPGVSPTVPAPLDVATDDSASVITSPSSAITALIPSQSGFITITGVPAFIVPMADSATAELSIESPEQQGINSPVTPPMSSSPVIPHPINAPMSFQIQMNSFATATTSSPQPIQQPAVLAPFQHIGQSLETELQKAVRPELGPEPDAPPMIEVTEPFSPPNGAAPGKVENPRTEQPGSDLQKPNQPDTMAPTSEKAPPALEAPPLWWVPLPVPIPLAAPVDVGPVRGASGAFSPPAVQIRSSDQPALSAFLGVAAVTGGARLAMSESKRFGIHWLANRVASSRSARPRVAGR
jgi:hypothetical protein